MGVKNGAAAKQAEFNRRLIGLLTLPLTVGLLTGLIHSIVPTGRGVGVSLNSM